MNRFDVNKKIILITGSARGIGRHISDNLKEAGATVIDADISFSEFTDSKWGGDLHDDKNVDGLLSTILINHGRIDVLINNAGITLPSDKKPYPVENWDKTIQVNLGIPFKLTSKAIPLLSNSGSGSVINIASLNATMAFPNNPAYVASKTALLGLTRSMALDYGNTGIRFNSISPGYIKTDMTGESWTNLEKRQNRQSRTALGRWGTVDDLVGITFLLCSSSSSYITGQDFKVDGGWSIKGL
jgi:NAD(P)-dependent dehydrogenase (short-subunit alcohol dehydrogenase family)